LVADGQYYILYVPKNSQIIANQIPYAWLAFLMVAMLSYFSSIRNSLKPLMPF
jgi:hypothetical protein